MKKQREGGFLITQIHHRANRVFARMLEEHGIHEINPAQGRIMFVLWQNDGIPITELARQTSLDKSTLTSMLDRLEEAGFVVRVPSPHDRRKVLVKRTEKDRAWQKVYAQVSQEMTKLFYDGFAESEVDEFERYLGRILENLTVSDSA